MDPQFPGNSHTAKTTTKTKVTVETDKPEAKKVEKVVTTDAIQRKKSLGKRLGETFVGGDAKSVAAYVVMEVFVPQVKDMLADAMTQGVEKMLFGEARSARSRSSSIRPTPGGVGNYVNYNRMGSQLRSGMDEFAKQPSRQARATHNFDEILLSTRAEADMVIDRLHDLLQQYEVCTVADLYGLVGITENFTDAKWGWDDLRGSGVTRTRSGYLLDLPKPKPVD